MSANMYVCIYYVRNYVCILTQTAFPSLSIGAYTPRMRSRPATVQSLSTFHTGLGKEKRKDTRDQIPSECLKTHVREALGILLNAVCTLVLLNANVINIQAK